MKKLIGVLILFFLASLSLVGQGYEVLDNDPSKIIKGHVAFEYLTVDAGFANVSGAYAWAIGLNALYALGTFDVEGSFRTPILKLESAGDLAVAAEAGVNKTIFSKTKLKDGVKVLMSFSDKRSLWGRRVTTSTTITMPANIRTELFARGGGYHRNSTYEPDDAGLFATMSTIAHTGGYIGIGISKGTFFQFKSQATNKSFALGNLFKFYADLLLLPTNIEDPLYEDSDIIGWRVGVKWYNSPYTSANNFNQKRGLFGNMFAIMEMGTRPYEGAVITVSVGYVFMKF